MALALAANWEHRQMESPSSPSPPSNSRANNENENSSQNPQQPQPNLISSAGSDTASSQPQQTAHGQPQIQQPFMAQPTPWTPSPNAAPFYPSFNPFFQQNPGLAVPQQQPYFDPNMALAYQHMLMQQAHALQQQQAAAALQFNIRNAAGHPEFFAQHQQHPIMTGFPFGTATPPPHPAYPSPPPGALSPPGFRRGPPRSNAPDTTAPTSNDWARMHAFPQVPYARPDAAGSSNSVNSSAGSGQNNVSGVQQRGRTDSSNSAHGSASGSLRGHGRVPPISTNTPETRVRSLSAGSPTARAPPFPHQRTTSNSSDRPPSIRQNSNSGVGSNTTPQPQQQQPSQPSSPANRTAATRTVKPSPLSQQSTTFEGTSKANRRLSKDDSELLPQAPQVHASRSGGLKSRFKRALTLNALDEAGAPPSTVGQDGVPSPSASSIAGTTTVSSSASTAAVGDTSIRTTKPKSRSLFNGRFNASTDNISLSSTVSSASVMIRKLGSIGKLARKNSLSGITKLFKDKDKDKGEGGSGGGLNLLRKKGKGTAVEASVSMATAEIDRFEDPSLRGLSPAAQLARQHTLRSNAEADARRLKEQQEVTNANTASANGAAGVGGVPSAWEKDTASRAGGLPRHGNVGEEGRWDPDRISEDGESGEGGYDPIEEEDEDAIARFSKDRSEEGELDECEQWAVGINREVEKTKQPSKSILRNAKDYVQEQYLENGKEHFLRSRANSYNTTITSNTEPGPLAHIPSPDPDHIDGLQKPTNTAPSDATFSLPPLDFDFDTSDASKSLDALKVDNTATLTSSPSSSTKTIPNDKDMVTAADKGPSFAYTHAAANSSAPALSSMLNRTGSIAKTPSAPGLGRKISFAQNLAIYDTFSASVYDRRSEPSTANRLTPALAQRIKEELNSFKMEEMEVHSASRIHTHFFV